MYRFLTLPLTIAALSACDGRAGTGYHGTSLLSITGSVHLQNPDTPNDLVPALAFRLRDQRGFEIVDVDVRGEFPARFTLDVFSPPSENTIQKKDRAWATQPDFAVGYIAAVTPDHPATVVVGDGPVEGVEFSPSQGCSDASATPARCYAYSVWCRGSDCDPATCKDCYVEKNECDPAYTSCSLAETRGNPRLVNELWTHLAGVSRDYVVFYLPDGADRSTAIAYAFGGGEPLEAGYHLVHVEKLTPDELKQGEACEIAARQEAFRQYNAEHGTSYAGENDVPESELRAFETTRLAAMMSMRCPLNDERFTKVPETSTPIDVEIGTELAPALTL